MPEVSHFLGLRTIRSNLDIAIDYQKTHPTANIDDRLRDDVAPRADERGLRVVRGHHDDDPLAVNHACALRSAIPGGAGCAGSPIE